MPSSRLGCPLSLKTTHMEHPGLDMAEPILTTSLMEESPAITEAALLERFAGSLSRGSISRDVNAGILLRELGGLQGRPDLLDVYFRALPISLNLDTLALSLRSPSKARILAPLRYGAPRRRAYLEAFTGFNGQSLTRHLNELEEVGLIEVHETSSVSLTCPLPWEMADIVAYEGKLTNWRRALHQAITYRSFSHRVWVVMPMSGAGNAKKLESVFRANGFGLIAVNEDGTTHIKIRSRKRRPSSRRLYLMAIGAGLSNFLRERRRLHRRIRPESIESI